MSSNKLAFRLVGKKAAIVRLLDLIGVPDATCKVVVGRAEALVALMNL